MRKKEMDPIKAEKKRKWKKINRIIDVIFIICWLLYLFLPEMVAQLRIKNFDSYVKDNAIKRDNDNFVVGY